MIASQDAFEPHSSEQLPNSHRVYVVGQLYPELRVPLREITLNPTQNGRAEPTLNPPVRVYDTSGAWGDPSFQGDASTGLPALRRGWILARGDVGECDGRPVQPQDDGYLSERHRQSAKSASSDTPLTKAPRRRPLRAVAGHPVTQLWYARQGIITPEMEFIALRENQGVECTRIGRPFARPGAE